MKTIFWKVWLRLNLLTSDVDNDYSAEVSTVGNTKRNEDIARAIKEEGSEVALDTMVDLFNRRDRMERRMVCDGSSVQTGNVRLSPRVTGSWLGSSAKYDPDVHKLTVDAVMTDDLRKALEVVGVEVLGVKDSGAHIGLVTDTLTGATDGSITANDDVMIEGDKLRIIPETESGIGIFFINSLGMATPVTRRLTQNDPKKVVARVPALPAGEYTLQIVTRYSNSNTLLKELRVIEYGKKLTVS